MKKLKRIAGCWIRALGILWAGLLLAGCQTGEPVFTDFPGMATGGTGSEAGGAPRGGSVSDALCVGDWVGIAFAGTDAPPPTYAESVKEDGTMTLPLVGPVVVAGKTLGGLQKELQQKYDKLYKNLTVTVLSQGRFFYVTGEVRAPGPKMYLGETDIVKAISTAGDFTEFANKKKVRLIRADGHTKIINVRKAIADSQYHVPVYPGDKIVVPRRFF